MALSGGQAVGEAVAGEVAGAVALGCGEGAADGGEVDAGGVGESAGGGGEGATYWQTVLTEIRNRGVKDVLMLVCDGLTGLADAVNTV
ncbi:hypothetical protein KSE_45480 [Kitasatospora setae KM-6054]|uniref:Mutator family transposase n=1 Tax=Kitasatospora setae (strain ATCC 33774 / DSM 43861 / JCM 3304 / KCC A-0304 / NBRC 14216 / KM-6054) TaxID=452652 RepID=E4NFQ0_KITSK|nr:hypothetical protein KSE_45480 [Kitasatospora setae KM-6054]